MLVMRSSLGGRSDWTEGGGDGEKRADLRALLGVKVTGLSAGLERGGAEGVGGAEG